MIFFKNTFKTGNHCALSEVIVEKGMIAPPSPADSIKEET